MIKCSFRILVAILTTIVIPAQPFCMGIDSFPDAKFYPLLQSMTTEQALANRLLMLPNFIGRRQPVLLAELVSEIHIALSGHRENFEKIIHGSVRAEKVQPELVLPADLKALHAYKRFQNLDVKEHFRTQLVAELRATWEIRFGPHQAEELVQNFSQLAQNLNNNGALVFGNLISPYRFRHLVEAYDSLMAASGSASLLHSYLNIRNFPDFLTDTRFNDAFLHPLVVALIAYRMGGPIRIVDARAKDAGPITARAQDNMLHIDNTPYNDEYKVLLLWEKSHASGPKGQNFVFLPGTHKGARNSFIREDGTPWSTENASIFITPESIKRVFLFQQHIGLNPSPSVVEVSDPNRPLTTVFAAGSLVHHRYRTESGLSRSCLIIAFHPSSDNPGEFIHDPHFTDGRAIQQYLMEHQDSRSATVFLNKLIGDAPAIAAKLVEILSSEGSAVVIHQDLKPLSENAFHEWSAIAAHAPEIEDLKLQRQGFPYGQRMTTEEFIKQLGSMFMFYDKHGPLDLILYADSHEEIRKWARNRIREMRSDFMMARLEKWGSQIRQPTLSQALTPEMLTSMAQQLIHYIDHLAHSPAAGLRLEASGEKISLDNAYRSIRQLIEDLSEALLRSYSFQNFVSTSLFLFWTCDELIELTGREIPELKALGTTLLQHYITSAIALHLDIINNRQLSSQLQARAA